MLQRNVYCSQMGIFYGSMDILLSTNFISLQIILAGKRINIQAWFSTNNMNKTIFNVHRLGIQIKSVVNNVQTIFFSKRIFRNIDFITVTVKKMMSQIQTCYYSLYLQLTDTGNYTW